MDLSCNCCSKQQRGAGTRDPYRCGHYRGSAHQSQPGGPKSDTGSEGRRGSARIDGETGNHQGLTADEGNKANRQQLVAAFEVMHREQQNTDNERRAIEAPGNAANGGRGEDPTRPSWPPTTRLMEARAGRRVLRMASFSEAVG